MARESAEMTNDAVTPSPTTSRTDEKYAANSGCDPERTLENASPDSPRPNRPMVSAMQESPQPLDQEMRPTNWNDEPLFAVMNHIVQKHHTYCRQAIAAIEPLLVEVLRNHGEKHPELKLIKPLFAKLSRELLMHLVKEEATLFPYIARMEEAVSRKEVFPKPAYGTVANPVRMMTMEHDVSNTDFKGIRQASNNYESPPDAGPNYKAVYQALKELEQDLRVHSDLEDKVLFPRAVALEGVAESIAGGAKVSPP